MFKKYTLLSFNCSHIIIPDEMFVLSTRSHTIYGKKDGCSIFHSAKFEQMTTPQQVLLQWEIIIDGTAVTIVLVCTF
jgi:hypothetical protein